MFKSLHFLACAAVRIRQISKHDLKVPVGAILHEPRIIQRGRKCCLESTALAAKREKAKNWFCEIIYLGFHLGKNGCVKEFFGKTC